MKMIKQLGIGLLILTGMVLASFVVVVYWVAEKSAALFFAIINLFKMERRIRYDYLDGYSKENKQQIINNIKMLRQWK